MKTAIILLILALTMSFTYQQGCYEKGFGEDKDHPGKWDGKTKPWCVQGPWSAVPGMQTWCTNNCVEDNWDNCNGVCEQCSDDDDNSSGFCPLPTWQMVPGMQVWCNNNCVPGNWDNCFTNCQTNCPSNTQKWCPLPVWSSTPGIKDWCKLNCVAGNEANCQTICVWIQSGC